MTVEVPKAVDRLTPELTVKLIQEVRRLKRLHRNWNDKKIMRKAAEKYQILIDGLENFSIEDTKRI